MGRIGSFVTIEAFLIFNFSPFQGGCGLIGSGHVVFRGLEIVPVPLIGENGGGVRQLPVGADR